MKRIITLFLVVFTTITSMAEQIAGSKGSITPATSTPNYLIFQCGQFNESKALYNNITTNYSVSIRPVTAAE